MEHQDSKIAKIHSLSQIPNLSNYIFWSRPGNGTLHCLNNHFDSSEYLVHRIITPHISPLDLKPLPVLGQHGEVSHVISNEFQDILKSRDVDGKKLVLIFDEISNATEAGANVLYNAAIHRKFGDIELNDDDIVICAGMCDPKDNPYFGDLSRVFYNKMSHCILELKPAMA